MVMISGHFPIGHIPDHWPEGHWPLPPLCPVDISEIKDHLRVEHTEDDTLINQLMLAATSWAEMFQRRFYISRPNMQYLDEFPEIIKPSYSPLISVISIQYVDEDGNIQTLASDYYRIDNDTEPGRITEAYGYSWPATRNVINAIQIRYKSGYGYAADVPDEIKAAIKLLVGHWYENRLSVAESICKEVPQAAISLLWNRKIIDC